MGRRQPGWRDDSGSWLATLLIVAVGGGFCAFVTLSANPDAVLTAGSVVAGLVGVFVVLNLLNRGNRSTAFNLRFLSVSSRNRRDDGLQDYQPRKAGSAPASAGGVNQPITAGEAKELRLTSASTWIPSRGRKTRSGRS
jgi:hypothetical protein